MNKTISGKHCTICWHVDYIKIFLMSPKVIEEVLFQLTTKYGKVSQLTVSQGCVQDYLGMRLDYGTKGNLRITIPKHVEGVLEAEAEKRDNVSDTPSANHMFQVQKDGVKLMPVQADFLQTILVNILFISCQSKPNLNTALSFFTIWVRNTDEGDHKKLARTIRYIRRKRVMYLTLEVESMYAIWWCINTSYGIHPDLKVHSSSMMLLGKGAATSKSRNRRINSSRFT